MCAAPSKPRATKRQAPVAEADGKPPSPKRARRKAQAPESTTEADGDAGAPAKAKKTSSRGSTRAAKSKTVTTEQHDVEEIVQVEEVVAVEDVAPAKPAAKKAAPKTTPKKPASPAKKDTTDQENELQNTQHTGAPASLPPVPTRQAASIPLGSPNQTVYINNLNDKINKEVLRKTLYMLFSPHGHIVSVVALKTAKARGQAFVAFGSVASATSAIRAMQGIELFGKVMRIVYARGKSDAVAKLDGTYRLPSSAPVAAAASAGDVIKYADDDSDMED